jgi:hypothetical protein
MIRPAPSTLDWPALNLQEDNSLLQLTLSPMYCLLSCAGIAP